MLIAYAGNRWKSRKESAPHASTVILNITKDYVYPITIY
jgi:hypothetical protein